MKTLNNTTASKASDNVSDIEFWGNGDVWKLISKASSKKEGWMKSTKAMEIPRTGCLVQVTTQQGDNIAEALTWVPGVRIGVYIADNAASSDNNDSEIVARKIVPIEHATLIDETPCYFK